MERLKAIWRGEPVLIVTGVLDVAIVVMSAIGDGLTVEAVILAGLVSVSGWFVRNRVYSPATAAKLERALEVYISMLDRFEDRMRAVVDERDVALAEIERLKPDQS